MDCYFPSERASVQGPTRLAGHRHQPQGRALDVSPRRSVQQNVEWRRLRRPFDSRLVAGVFDPSALPTSFGPFLASLDRTNSPTVSGRQAQDTPYETGILRQSI